MKKIRFLEIAYESLSEHEPLRRAIIEARNQSGLLPGRTRPSRNQSGIRSKSPQPPFLKGGQGGIHLKYGLPGQVRRPCINPFLTS